jgi:transcriptional regulator with XRE-family HTH domain
MKIKWDPVPAFVGWNRVKSLRKFRGLSQAEVAVGADVSVVTLYSLEMGYEERTTDEVKKKLTKFFDVDLDDLFPVEMVGNQPREKYLAKIKKGEGRPVVK